MVQRVIDSRLQPAGVVGGGAIHYYWTCFRSNPNMTLFVGKHLNTMAVTVGDGIKRVLGKYFPELVIFVFAELPSFPETANFFLQYPEHRHKN